MKLSLKRVIWLLPVAYFFHFFEEGERFREWAEIYWGPGSRAAQYFYISNPILMALMILCVIYFILKPEKGGIIAGLAAASWAFTNALIHIGYTLITGVYSPGVVTACLFYIPLTLYLYGLVKNEGALTNRRLVLSIFLGAGFMMLMFILDILHI